MRFQRRLFMTVIVLIDIQIVCDAVVIEKSFVCDSLPVDLIGMNSIMMATYIEFCADRLLLCMGCEKFYGAQNPFPWMEMVRCRCALFSMFVFIFPVSRYRYRGRQTSLKNVLVITKRRVLCRTNKTITLSPWMRTFDLFFLLRGRNNCSVIVQHKKIRYFRLG